MAGVQGKLSTKSEKFFIIESSTCLSNPREVAGCASVKQEEHRAREGTVKLDQLWGLISRDGSAACLGVDMRGEGRCMLDLRMQLPYILCAVVSAEEIADDQGARNYSVNDACRTIHATFPITTGSQPVHIGHVWLH
jgi:hypothetical protein